MVGKTSLVAGMIFVATTIVEQVQAIRLESLARACSNPWDRAPILLALVDDNTDVAEVVPVSEVESDPEAVIDVQTPIVLGFESPSEYLYKDNVGDLKCSRPWHHEPSCYQDHGHGYACGGYYAPINYYYDRVAQYYYFPSRFCGGYGGCNCYSRLPSYQSCSCYPNRSCNYLYPSEPCFLRNETPTTDEVKKNTGILQLDGTTKDQKESTIELKETQENPIETVSAENKIVLEPKVEDSTSTTIVKIEPEESETKVDAATKETEPIKINTDDTTTKVVLESEEQETEFKHPLLEPLKFEFDFEDKPAENSETESTGFNDEGNTEQKDLA